MTCTGQCHFPPTATVLMNNAEDLLIQTNNHLHAEPSRIHAGDAWRRRRLARLVTSSAAAILDRRRRRGSAAYSCGPDPSTEVPNLIEICAKPLKSLFCYRAVGLGIPCMHTVTSYCFPADQGRHFNFFLEGQQFFYIFRCHQTIEKLEKKQHFICSRYLI